MITAVVAGAQRPILVVEDEPALSEAIKYSLEREGYKVDTVADGREAIHRFHSNPPSMVLLDLMLPEIAGLEVCRLMRRESIVPILLVTAKDAEADKVVGLEMGADDYITKPFSMRELVSRVRAHLRRAGMSPPGTDAPVLSVGFVEIDVEAHVVKIRGEPVTLPPKEFALLKTLVEGAGRLMTRNRLIEEVWGSDYVGDTRTLDVHVKRLRAKLEEDRFQPRHLRTVRGLGYKFEV